MASVEKKDNLAILLVTFLGWLSDSFGSLSDLQLGDKKVTLNHLEIRVRQPNWKISAT